jgi:pyruvate,water dikinase
LIVLIRWTSDCCHPDRVRSTPTRYAHPAYAKGFTLECEAMKRVRNEMGLTNVILMILFCRRVQEGEKVLDSMAAKGIKRGENILGVYLMCEIPA